MTCEPESACTLGGKSRLRDEEPLSALMTAPLSATLKPIEVSTNHHKRSETVKFNQILAPSRNIEISDIDEATESGMDSNSCKPSAETVKK